ncbi:MAG: hypothetical protein LBV79_02670 [Candidatus Adiutrix sp.]|jgi:hypothetical protein|nr:hypothetical protein [Candidatus Adiutrix sp.]
MKKILPCLAMLFALALLLPAPPAHSAAQTAEEFVGAFYAWYAEASQGDGDPWEDDAMLKYVPQGVVEAVRNGDNQYRLDFLQVGMTYEWNSPVAHKAFPMEGNLMAVPVSMQMAGEDWHVIVFVHQDGESMSIVKIANIFPLVTL